MAHLLGSKACIDSLRVDVDDLENVTHDIIGKTGSIKCHSWKFPDKLATDVNIKEILERYQYGKNELDNQVSHIILFEVIIDRLLLVIHSSWRFLHEIQTKLLPNTLDSSSTVHQQTCLSIGLVVKKYWTKLSHLFTILQQHESNRKRSHPTTTSIQLQSTYTIDQHCQTIETSLAPCPSCTKLQQCLRNYGDKIINLCDVYNLPSTLAHHRSSSTIIPEWLSSDDISHWFDCQLKDFDRLSEYLEQLTTTLNKTKHDLDLSEKRCKQENQTNHRLQQIINENTKSKKLLENQINEMKKEHEQEKLNLNGQIQILTTAKINLEQKMKELNEELTSRGEKIEKLEPLKNELKTLTEAQRNSDNLIKTLEQDRIRLQTELDVIKRDLEERNRESQKERIRIENMIRQEENFQSKQKTLTKSHEELSQECEGLKKQVTELEVQRDELQKSLQSHMETNNHVLEEVTSLKTNIEQLQQQMKEREQMLFSSPDFNTTTQSSDNLLLHDIQHQMQTNDLRIDLLRKQNDSLKSSLEKYVSTNRNTDLSRRTEERYQRSRRQSDQDQSYTNTIVTPKPKQTPLWLLNTEIIEQQQQHAFTETRPVTTINFLPRSNENDRLHQSNSDINVELLSQPNNHVWTTTTPTQVQSKSLLRTSNIPSATNLNKTQGTPTSNRPPTVAHTRRDVLLPKSSRMISSAKTQRVVLDITHRCTNCNQSFDDKRNYYIHKLYCRT